MRAYYNENDYDMAAWLRDLIQAGEITKGDVDDRSIEDVRPADLVGYTRCHFFAGVAGWDRGLDLAGWGDEAVWTGEKDWVLEITRDSTVYWRGRRGFGTYYEWAGGGFNRISGTSTVVALDVNHRPPFET